MFSWKKNNLRSAFQAPFILVVYLITSVDSIEWLDFASLVSKDTACFTSQLFGASRFYADLSTEVVFFNWLSSIFSSGSKQCTRSTLFSLYVDLLQIPRPYKIVYPI